MPKATFYGVGPPFIGGTQGVLSRQEDERLIKNDILLLLYTIPGERMHRPRFGVNLRNFIFEQSTDADVDTLRAEINEALITHEPRVRFTEVTIARDDDRTGLSIMIVGYLKKDPKKTVTVEQFLASRA
jgi:phage baseplate assembly protein W